MLHKYLKDHIVDEIDGAMDYMEKAIEYKNSPMGGKFYKMAEMELEHANCMTKMFNNLDKSEDITGEDYSKMYKDILDVYSTSMGKIEAMKKLYYS